MKKRIIFFTFFISLLIPGAFINASEFLHPHQKDRSYLSAFAGGIFTNSSTVSQIGTAFLENGSGLLIKPLEVLATGNLNGSGRFLGGLNGGYEWRNCPYLLTSNLSVAPAIEFEAFWYNANKKGRLVNDTTRLTSHVFYDTFPMYSGVYLTNFVFSFYNCSDLTPYLAVGLGAARINIRNAYSEQLEQTPEPGINHFNTDVSETDWTFAAQFKLGLKYALCDRWHIFAEYRYLFVDFNSYMFGSTKYTGHVTTSPWFVQFENINHNACVIGIQYDL